MIQRLRPQQKQVELCFNDVASGTTRGGGGLERGGGGVGHEAAGAPTRSTARLLHVGERGHAGLAVELGLLVRVGEGEPERLDELPPLIVVAKCQLGLNKVNRDRHAVSKSGGKEKNE